MLKGIIARAVHGPKIESPKPVFDETKLTDKQWVAWKKRCFKNLMGFEFTGDDGEILKTRVSKPGSKETQ